MRFSALFYSLLFFFTHVLSMNNKLESVKIVTITVYQDSQKKSYTKEQRSIYCSNDESNIILEYPVKIASESFCKKIVDIAERYQTNAPVIPVTNSLISELEKYPFNAASEIEKHRIYFNEQYTLQKEPPYLRFIVGHELAHRNYDTLEYKDIISENNWRLVSTQRLLFLLIILAVTGPKSVNNIFESYLLTTYRYGLLGSIIYFLFWPSISIKKHKELELTCDQDAVMKFNGTIGEKINVAQEGISYFQATQRNESFLQKINQFFILFINDYNKPHPSYEERIKNLEVLIVQLRAQKKNYNVIRKMLEE